MLVEQPHADERHAEIAGGLELIAGDIAQPAGINRQCSTQHELHAEIRHTRQTTPRVSRVKPRWRLRRAPFRLHEVVEGLDKDGIGQRAPEPLA